MSRVGRLDIALSQDLSRLKELGVQEALKDIPCKSIEVDAGSRLVVTTEPHSPGADRFRFVRNALRQRRMAGQLRSIAIVSPLPHDGKSTVAMNLAAALAESGRESVLCIEADLYHPTIAQSLSYDATVGVPECVTGEIDPLSAIVRFDPLRWYLLPAGAKRDNPNQILQADAMAGLLRKLEKSFDWILLDTPPLALIRDTVGLVGQTDGALLVVRAGQTPRNLIEESVKLIGERHALGIVLNAADEINTTYAKYYGSYYKKAH